MPNSKPEKMRIHAWLKKVVNDTTFSAALWWHNREKGLLAIHWKHASYDDYAAKDSALFKQWAIDNHRYDLDAQDSPEERKRWKTNFRCALHSATDIKKIETLSGTKMRKQSYRVFQLLEKPDPEKVVQKKKSNREAAKSKLKQKGEKRCYRSRLNKCRKEYKSEPKTFGESSTENRFFKGEATTVKIEPVDPHSMYRSSGSSFNVESVDKYDQDASLPATLDDLHEDEAYFSFSDSASENSHETSYSPVTQSEAASSSSYFIPLAPVETIFHQQHLEHFPSTTGESEIYTQEYFEMDTDEGVIEEYATTNDTGNLYLACGQWGTKVSEDSCIHSQNVITEFYTDHQNSHLSSAIHQDRHYSLTPL